MRYALLLCTLLLTAAAGARADKITTSEDLIRAMQKRYAKTWYRTLTFKQKTTNFHEDGTKEEAIWYEALYAPGRLRIDFDPVSQGNGILFVNDTLYRFKDGAQQDSRPFVHPLLVLGFDIYFMTPEDAIKKLQGLKFDLSTFREDTWQGRPAYVVGAKSGDLHSQQFWVDKENLYFVRMLGPAGKDGTRTQETQFNKYFKVKGGGWVSPEVIFMIDGKPRTTEEYTEVRTDVPLDDKLFDPQYWKTAHWR
ncbi:MAG: outer membrane lipoprotein-sorting protein [Acidobacteriota bacterium]|nr:outer membrane lipoprotein-sorting protein [Acidobacteriota bacterium]